MDIKKYISAKRKIIDNHLDKCLPSVKLKPRVIHKAMRYSVFSGGKRIRPIMTLAGFEACGGKAKDIIKVACAIELIHTYTLIHDDLPCMDNDDHRRGKLSCHKKFGENIALLAGDAILTLGFGLLSEAGNIEVVKETAKAIGSCGTIGGQVVDMEISLAKDNLKLMKKEIDYVARCKTGALFEIAVKSAGIIKGVGEKKITELGNFGRLVGRTFQMVDDLIDKDGYCKLYSAEHVKKMAHLFNERAKSHLGIFGKTSSRLACIADLILARTV